MRERRRRRSSVAKTAGRTVGLAWSAAPASFVALLVLALLVSLIPPALVWLGKRLVDLVASSDVRPITRGDLTPTILGLGLLVALQRTLGTFQGTQQFLFARKVHLSAERPFLERAATADLGHFDDSDWHDRMARAARDLEFRPSQLVQVSVGLLTSTVTLIGMLGILLALHPVLVMLALVSVIPGIVAQRRQTKRLIEFWWRNTPEEREQGYLRQVLTEPKTSKELRAFGLADYLLDRYGAIADARHARMAHLYHQAQRQQLLTGLLAGLAMAGGYWFVGSRALRGELTAGDLTAVTGAVASASGLIQGIAQSFVLIEEHASFLDDYYEFLALPPLLGAGRPDARLPSMLDQGISLEGVSFTYPGGTEPAVRGVDLHVRPGELLALVGDNGAGKSTLVKLLLRFYEPSEGTIRFGGMDLRDVSPDEVRRRIGVLFQDYATYELSARDNVTIGRVERDLDDETVWSALRRARAAPVVESLRDGLDSKVGRLFEGGHDLSGGEWQRLALARLMYRDADVWILDEPTASLDAEVEAAIFAELREQLAGRIGIVISHRFSTVRIADRIAVFADGRVTELGTHEELVALGGRYAQLFELQAAGYR